MICLCWLFVQSSIGATADRGRCGWGGGNVAQTHLAGEWSHHCHLQLVALTIPATYQDRTCQWLLSWWIKMVHTPSCWIWHRKSSISDNPVMCSNAACAFSVPYMYTMCLFTFHEGITELHHWKSPLQWICIHPSAAAFWYRTANGGLFIMSYSLQ